MYKRTTLLSCLILGMNATITVAAEPIHTGFGQQTDANLRFRIRKLVVDKNSIPGIIKVARKRNKKMIGVAELRRKYPAGYKLYKKSKRLGRSFQVNENSKLPQGCSMFADNAFRCTYATWFCEVIWTEDLDVNCGRYTWRRSTNKLQSQ